MFTNRFISYGIATAKKKLKASILADLVWLESLERSRASFGLEGVRYEYWTYPAPGAEGSIWIRNNKNVVFFLSDGFLKVATETQVVTMMESLNAGNFQETRRQNKKEALSVFINSWKGESRHYRYWIFSFFLYPLERILKIAKI